MSTFEWIQLTWNVLVTGLFVHVYRNLHESKKQLLILENLKAQALTEEYEIRLKQLEVDARKNQELLAQSLEPIYEKMKVLQKLVEENIESLSSPSVEAVELRQLAQAKDDIPTVRQIERTQARLEAETHIDLRTLLREQLA